MRYATKRIKRYVAMIGAVGIVMMPIAVPTAVAAGAVSPRAYVQKLVKNARMATQIGGENADSEFSKQFDISLFSQRCLIDHWESLADKQRAEFTDVFSQVLRRRLDKVVRKSFGGRKFTYVIGNAQSDSDGVIRVSMIAKVDDISIDFGYFLVHEGQSYKMVDYEIKGVLLSRNYRGHFNYLMRKYGFKGMMEKMHAKKQRLAQK